MTNRDSDSNNNDNDELLESFKALNKSEQLLALELKTKNVQEIRQVTSIVIVIFFYSVITRVSITN